MKWLIEKGDCVEVMRSMPEASIDAIVCDPPYGLGFMDKDFDKLGKGAAQREWHKQWAVEALRVLKPGGHAACFGGTRTSHHLASGLAEVGFEIRDSIIWIYGSGFPKSLSVGKAIDGKLLHGRSDSVGLKAANASRPGDSRLRQTTLRNGKKRWVGGAVEGPKVTNDNPATPEGAEWNGWGTALKPAHEPIILARKPLIGTVAENVLAYGTGALNIDACRVGAGDDRTAGGQSGSAPGLYEDGFHKERKERPTGGRWPANVIHDGSADVFSGKDHFFYCAKPSRKEREAGCDSLRTAEQGAKTRLNNHPCVKPIALMTHLVKMVAPPGGVVLDPFAGSGTTGIAALQAGMRVLLIEKEPDYCVIATARMNHTHHAAEAGP